MLIHKAKYHGEILSAMAKFYRAGCVAAGFALVSPVALH